MPTDDKPTDTMLDAEPLESRDDLIRQCGCGPSTPPWSHWSRCPLRGLEDKAGWTLWDHTRAVIQWICGERELSKEEALGHLDQAEALATRMHDIIRPRG